MNSRNLLTTGAALLMSCAALAQNEPPATPPGEARPQSTEQANTRQVPADPYAELNKQVQEKLRAMGFYKGPVNGEFGPNTQAALAQFQLSWPLPASGMLDSETLAALGVEPPAAASAGASGEASANAALQQSVEASANGEASSEASRPAEAKGN
jgi:peptidoglycan hydrolase-like protein with peptidoglycan-binding domain